MGGGASRWRRAAKKIVFPCASVSRETPHHHHHIKTISSSAATSTAENSEGITEEAEFSGFASKSMCAICLEPLNCGSTDGQAVFTAQCMHAFHSVCISSNVRHGSVNCPICRARWSQLPPDLTPACLLPSHQTDPILRILDDSIATFRVNRRSSLRSTRYDDDDPVEPENASHHPRLHLALIPVPMLTSPSIPYHRPGHSPCGHSKLLHHQFIGSSSLVPQQTTSPNGQNKVYLSVKLSQQQATDLVLVASPNGPHLRLLKQSMALVIFSLRSVDRLAIVTYSSAATRAFPLRRMSSHGKRAALQVIDRLFYLGEADPTEGLRKGVKILEDRMHRNPLSCILHLSDSPTRAYVSRDLQVPVPIHRFHIGFGFGTSNGFVMHEFEEFLSRLLGGVIRETQLRIGEEGGLIRLGELRGGEERRIPLDLMGDCGFICVGYSYIEGGAEERLRTGELVVGIAEKSERSDGGHETERRDLSIARSSSVERWEYLDPFMARRWAKHLHGYRA